MRNILQHRANKHLSTGAAGIGTLKPNASSLLDIKSTSKGILIPRMTKNQRDAIVTPVTGLLIYQTNSTPGFYYYTGSAWMAVSPTVATGANASLSNLAATSINKSLIPSTTNLMNLGTKTIGWKDIYATGSIYLDGAKFIDNSGTDNTFIGNTGNVTNTGSSNTMAGKDAGASNTTGFGNSFFGKGAGISNTEGYYNSFFGQYAGASNTTGIYNTANGFDALGYNTTGYYNTASGFEALYYNTTGYYNTAIGVEALYFNTTGHDNAASGVDALYHNTTGNYNSANGNYALFYNTTGYSNTANGFQALRYNTTGYGNTATGDSSLFSSTTGFFNTATGSYALNANTTGYANIANGAYALDSNTTGYLNTANGFGALYSNNIGNSNTGNGVYALFSNTTGNDNTAIGFGALNGNTMGNSNTGLGMYADVSSGNLSNATALGYSANATASNQVRIGDYTVTSIGGQVGWTSLSDGRVKKNIKENVPGLIFINKLKSLTYNLDLDNADKIIQCFAIKTKDGKTIEPTPEQLASRRVKEQIIYTGFIAQDVEKAAKELNYDFSGVDAPKNDKDLYGLRYAEFVVPLVKAVQELSKQNDSLKETLSNQQSSIVNQQKINTDLQKQLNDLKTLILSLQQCSPCNGSGANAQTYNTIITDVATLEQNVPNPFAHNTTIGYTLPQKITAAQIMITDKSGKILKLINVSGSGKGSLNVDASTLSAGAYQYSLMINGKLIGTKQMVLAK